MPPGGFDGAAALPRACTGREEPQPAPQAAGPWHGAERRAHLRRGCPAASPAHCPGRPFRSASFSAETLERGRQVFALGNCASCHTAEGGIANAGGRPVVTPFGTIYSTNLTPDPETGLGRWSFEAFDRAMRHGISRDGHNLYPAFPYTSFAKMSGEDMLALYAFLQTLAPVSQATPQAQMIAPANLRPALSVWNLLYHDARPFMPEPAKGGVWNRGKYLVEAAGHCSLATPRAMRPGPKCRS
ncbi:cytochrome c [Pannonibacter sp. Pt2-lr]